MATPILTARRFWLRLAVVGALVWTGGVGIASVTMQHFQWFEWAGRNWTGGTGPAFWTAALGVLVIFVLGFGIPWVAAAAIRE